MWLTKTNKAEESNKVFTLPEVVEHYVIKNDDILDDDFTSIDSKIKKNIKIMQFLDEQKRGAYQNEKSVYEAEKSKLTGTNKELNLQKGTLSKQIEANKIGYKKIDLSFLSMKKYVHRKSGLQSPFFPAFSIHKYIKKDRKFLPCVIDIEKHFIRMKDENHLSSYMFLKNLFKAFVSDIDEDDFCTSHWGEVSYRSKRCLLESGDQDIRLTSTFQGIIPETTKEKIDNALNIFSDYDNCGIFLIKECLDWKVSEITKDPLIVGIIDDQTYLIDHFDCTDLEDYVKAEFTE